MISARAADSATMWRLVRWGFLVAIVAAMIVAGVGLMFTTFLPMDDEGYMLYAINAFAERGGLYVLVDSQYGPFFHLFHQGLHAAGARFTPDGARILMLVYWLLTAAFCGLAAWKGTRSSLAAMFALAGSFLHLSPFVNEPAHPGGIIAVALAGLAWLGTVWSDRPGRLAAAAGAIGAALIFTKINVGVFVLAGAGAWWLVHLDSGRGAGSRPAWIAAALLAAMPFGLVGKKLSLGWAVTLAVVAAAGSAALIAAIGRSAPRVSSWRNLTRLALAGGFVGIFSVGGVVIQGSSLADILEGVLLNPLRHPGTFMSAIAWEPGALPFAVLSVAAAAWVGARGPESTGRIVAFARLAALAVFAIVWLLPLRLDTRALLLSYGISSAWIFVAPLRREDPRLTMRTWLALLLVPQVLHAFPVAGSQIAWGTFLWIPLAVTGAHEALGLLTPEWPDSRTRVRRALAVAVSMVLLAGVAQSALFGLRRLRRGESLGIPGTEWIRLPSWQASTLRILSQNARLHADVLFSFPGLLSFNHWSGVTPPTPHNNTQWFTLLDAHEQDEIHHALETARRSAVIFQKDELASLAERKIATETPLARWLRSTYEPAFVIGAYEFRVPRGRRIAPIGVATMGTAPETAPLPSVISATIGAIARESLATVELHRFKGLGTERIASWKIADALPSFSHVDATGESAAQPTQFMRVQLIPGNLPAGLNKPEAILYFLDASGRRLAEARLL